MSKRASGGTSRLLTVREVAERLHVSVALVYSMVRAGTLPALRVGNGRGSIRFREPDVEEYLENCAVTGRKPDRQRTRPEKTAKHEFKHLQVGKRGRR